MWPQALQMTRDECRGVLRRLELESYSQVISVFRAQGGLTDTKAKALEELRLMLHISQERHRAEARRVANDEQLSTIAEAISGPNTWQEWSREGRRSFALLPRVAPQTALAFIANTVAAEAAAENAKLPYPSETGAVVAEEQRACNAVRDLEFGWSSGVSYVVKSDPFKMPDIPSAAVVAKKSLKRNMPDSSNSGSSKKRLTSDANSPVAKQQQQQQHQHPHQSQKLYQHITASTNSSDLPASPPPGSAKKLHHNHHNKLPQQQQQQNKLLSQQQQNKLLPQQQQQQQQQSPKVRTPSRKAAAALQSVAGVGGGNNATPKKLVTPAKCGRRAQKLQEQQQRKLNQHQTSDPSAARNNNAELTTSQLVLLPSDESLNTNTTLIIGSLPPQIAASKKDITKNLTKLQIQAAAAARPAASLPSPATAGVDAINAASLISSSSKGDKQQLQSSPVQKYIVEDRQVALGGAIAPLQMVNATTSPQIMQLPTGKLRPVNAAKIAAKKLAAVSNATLLEQVIGAPTYHTPQQVYSLIDSSAAPASLLPHPGGGSSSAAGGCETTPSQQPAQGKVLTTKLLPIVLSGGSANASGGTLTKIETLNNGGASGSPTLIKNLASPSMLVAAGVSSGTGGAVANHTLNSPTILTTAGTVFRKAPNLIKTTTGLIGVGAGTIMGNTAAGTKISSSLFNASGSSAAGPQIISNIKLTPAIGSPTNTAGGAAGAAGQHHTNFLQHTLKGVVPASGLRTSVKICQSPNGKVFLQPANLDAANRSKLAAGLQHNLLASALSGGSGTPVGSGSGGGAAGQQRIAIQKVQIIPAPPNGGGGALTANMQSHQSRATALTIGSGGVVGQKSNVIFMPSPSMRAAAHSTAAALTLSKGSLVTAVPKTQTQTGAVADVVKPANVVVIGASTLPHNTSNRAATTATTNLNPNNTLDSFIVTSSGGGAGSEKAPNSGSVVREFASSQMITEDTPVDILVDGSSDDAANRETLTIVSSLSQTHQQQQQQQQDSTTVILGATDWEMELDQAAGRSTRPQSVSTLVGSGGGGGEGVGRSRKAQKATAVRVEARNPAESTANLILDDCYEDVIVEEAEEMGEEQGAGEEQVLLLDGKKHSLVGAAGGISDNELAIGGTGGEEGSQQTVVIEDAKLDVIDMDVEEDDLTRVAPPAESATRLKDDDVAECDQADAGFDETIGEYTEIDDDPNTVEYIDEQQNTLAAGGDERSPSKEKRLFETSSPAHSMQNHELLAASTTAYTEALDHTDGRNDGGVLGMMKGTKRRNATIVSVMELPNDAESIVIAYENSDVTAAHKTAAAITLPSASLAGHSLQQQL